VVLVWILSIWLSQAEEVAAVQTAVVVVVRVVTEMGPLLWWLVLTRLRLAQVVLQPQAMLELA
jgi:hypothetical protein